MAGFSGGWGGCAEIISTLEATEVGRGHQLFRRFPHPTADHGLSRLKCFAHMLEGDSRHRDGTQGMCQLALWSARLYNFS